MYQHESGRPSQGGSAHAVDAPLAGASPCREPAVTPADPNSPPAVRAAPAVAPALAPSLGGAAHGPLPALVAVDVTGDDAGPFLQGQLCNDLVALAPGAAQLNGWCSPKGRLLASPTVHRLADGFRLVLPADLVPGFVQRLRMFVLRAAVSVAPRDDLVALALFAPADAAGQELARAWLDAVGVGSGDDDLAAGTAPRAALGPDGASALVVHELRAGPGTAPLRRLLAFVPAASADAVAAAVPGATALSAAGADGAWRLADVRAGVAQVRAATRDAFVPQMVNFGEAGGLSFKKGCYPGQEIVARMQYLGKLKRHMRAFRTAGAPAGAPTGATPVPGDALDARGAGDASAAGGGAEVVDAVGLDDGSVELLAVVRVDAGDVELDVGGAPARPFELPYVPPGAGEARGRAGAGAVADAGGTVS